MVVGWYDLQKKGSHALDYPSTLQKVKYFLVYIHLKIFNCFQCDCISLELVCGMELGHL